MKTILVVDDDFAMRRGIVLMLKGEGYQVSEAQDSDIAMELLTERFYDLSIVDLFLPGRDGLELAQEIRRCSPNTKILMVTAHVKHARAKEARHQFQNHFMEKTNIDQLLTKKIHEILNYRRKS